jgi:hypothetical protein
MKRGLLRDILFPIKHYRGNERIVVWLSPEYLKDVHSDVFVAPSGRSLLKKR